jgi:hypothetical protein
MPDMLLVQRCRRIGLDVEAMRFMPLNQREVADWCGGLLTVIPRNGDESRPDLIILLKGIDRDMKARLGDYVIKLSDSVFYSCDHATFESLYEIIDNGS